MSGAEEGAAQGSEGKVLGIGGLFIRSENPDRLAAWYRQHLGFTFTTAGNPDPDGNWTWQQEQGHTVIAAFPKNSNYFSLDRQVMLNLRVSGLDAIVTRLEKAGIEVTHQEAMEGVGRFSRIHDCDGNPVELWEPVGE